MGCKAVGSQELKEELCEAGSRAWNPLGRQGEQAELANPPSIQALYDSNPHRGDPSQI